ncbi:MAG: Stf0 family sulfotransferase [Rhodobacteraceae bacterium]|jgi:LPS sulfotransferase NodH|nr:Stf0 family sulfotransferase [Paracoccaceae bacterium]
MKLYHAQFSTDLDCPDSPAPTRSLLVASTPRCGSHMLGHAMTTTGLLGVPFEYCNRANLAEWKRRLGTATAEATLAGVMGRRTTPNGVFGIKSHFEHCAALGGPAGLFAALPGLRVVHLRRADVMRQAVSYAVAKQTGVWIRGQEASGDRARYDADLIAWCLDDIALQNANWASAFAEAGIEPLNLYYEEVSANLPAAIAAVVRFAGVMPEDGMIEVETVTERQGEAGRIGDWVARYATDRREPERRGLLRGLLRV